VNQELPLSFSALEKWSALEPRGIYSIFNTPNYNALG